MIHTIFIKFISDLSLPILLNFYDILPEITVYEINLIVDDYILQFMYMIGLLPCILFFVFVFL